MERLIPRIDELIKSALVSWRREGHNIQVQLTKRSRTQVVRCARTQDRYVFRSSVLPPKLGHDIR